MQLTTSALLLATAKSISAAPQVIPGGGIIVRAEKVGDGNPHQIYHYKQLTSNIDCNDGPCEIARSDVKSFTISWGADISADGWVSGGFAVSSETQTGTVANCQSFTDADTDQLCVWRRTAHTAYTVQKQEIWSNGQVKGTLGDPYVMWSPNNDDVGSAYVCGRNGECQNQGAEFWGAKRAQGHPGGPQKYAYGGTPWQ